MRHRTYVHQSPFYHVPILYTLKSNNSAAHKVSSKAPILLVTEFLVSISIFPMSHLRLFSSSFSPSKKWLLALKGGEEEDEKVGKWDRVSSGEKPPEDDVDVVSLFLPPFLLRSADPHFLRFLSPPSAARCMKFARLQSFSK